MNRPNVLLLLTDQQRYDTIRSAGFGHMITPGMDKLAGLGCLYRMAYSSNPVCMPARHDMLTGLPGKFHGYYRNCGQPVWDSRLPTLPWIFAQNGYRTAAVGKMHFFPPRAHHGFEELFLMEELPDCRENDEYAMFLQGESLGEIQNLHGVRPHIYHRPQRAQMDEAHHGTTWVADRMMEWLDGQRGAPFFAVASWIAPHPPWALPDRWRNLYRGAELPDPIPQSRSYPFTPKESEWYGDTDSDREKRRIREAYYASVSMADENIGRLLDYLEKRSMMDNTLVILTSDHGEMLQDKGFYGKTLPYESSVRIPLIIKYPGGAFAGTSSGAFASLLDILPTCLDVCGLRYSGGERLPGISLRRLDGRNYQISAHGIGSGRWVMCRNSSHKYIFWYNNGTEELYDLQNDPMELENLLGTNHADEQAYLELRGRAEGYEREWGPQECTDGLLPLEGQEAPPTTCSKYSFWQNRQMQFFDNSPTMVRGKRFLEEIAYAAEDAETPLNAVFKHPEWRKSFLEVWKEYGDGVQAEPILFGDDFHAGADTELPDSSASQ